MGEDGGMSLIGSQRIDMLDGQECHEYMHDIGIEMHA